MFRWFVLFRYSGLRSFLVGYKLQSLPRRYILFRKNLDLKSQNTKKPEHQEVNAFLFVCAHSIGRTIL